MATTLQVRAKQTTRKSAAYLRIMSASQNPPPNAIRRVLHRLPAESAADAIARAKLTMPWWDLVRSEQPHSDSRNWIWYLRNDTTTLIK